MSVTKATQLYLVQYRNSYYYMYSNDITMMTIQQDIKNNDQLNEMTYQTVMISDVDEFIHIHTDLI